MSSVVALSVACSLLFLGAAVLLARSGRLQAGYAVFWVGTGLGMLLLSLAPGLIDRLGRALHIAYPPALLFLFGLLFAYGLILHLTTVVSHQAQQITDLAQTVALLRDRLAAGQQGEEPPSRRAAEGGRV